jgi:Protein of unknown function (DUF1566)
MTMKRQLAALALFCTVAAASPAALAAGPYTVSADGKEVTDAGTGLVWRRCAEGMTASARGCAGKALEFDHATALQHAHAQAMASGTAWRVPTPAELRGIADEKRFKLAIDTQAFPGTPPEHFWTSERTSAEYATAVHFYNGFHYDRYHKTAHHVRLVRSPR